MRYALSVMQILVYVGGLYYVSTLYPLHLINFGFVIATCVTVMP
jgi:hypothetical protein